MIEDPNLSLRILRYFAQDGITYPANLTLDQIQPEFEDIEEDVLLYHLWICTEAGLLSGDIKHIKSFGTTRLMVMVLYGLTRIGGEYVRNAETGFWDQALEELRNQGIAITTSNLIHMVSRFVTEAMQ